LLKQRKALPHKGDPASGAHPDDKTAGNAAEDRRTVFVSRIIVIFWGVVLSVLAAVMHVAADYFDHLLGLALGMAGFVTGGLMAGFFLGFFAKRLNINGTGF